MSTFQIHGPPSISNPDTNSANGNLLSPTQNGSRRAPSGGYSPLQTPLANGSNQNTPSSPMSSNNENGQWSSAVGHATTSGKSGRVIEKLMGDNDRLKRELKAQQVKAEELERSVQNVQPQIESLKTENENLKHARNVDQTLISRRDRQIKDLKAEVQTEKEKRQGFEALSQSLQHGWDADHERAEKECNKYFEISKHAEISAEISASSYKRLREEYETRVENVRKSLTDKEERIRHDAEQLEKLEVVTNQQRTEIERSNRIVEEMRKNYHEVQQLCEERVRVAEEQADAEIAQAHKMQEEMAKVTQEMRWVINLKENTTLAGGKGQGKGKAKATDEDDHEGPGKGKGKGA